MRPHRGDHRDGIHIRRHYEFVGVAMDKNPGVRRLYTLAGCGTLIADPDDLAAFQGAQIAHNIRPPITIADDAKLNHKTPPDELLCRPRRKADCLRDDNLVWRVEKRIVGVNTRR